MKLMESIRKCLQWSLGQRSKQDKSTPAPDTKKASDLETEDPTGALALQEGMSVGTARLIIDRYCGSELIERFKVSDPENRGRYYRVRLAEPDGRVSRELLVDKQSGQVICIQSC